MSHVMATSKERRGETLNGPTAAGLETQLAEAHRRYRALVLRGVAPRDAVSEVMRSFTGASTEMMRRAYAAFLSGSVGSRSSIPLRVGPVALSARLFANPDETAAAVQEILNRHLQAEEPTDFRKVALELFEGYGFREQEVLQMNPSLLKLPEFVEDAIRSGNNEAGRMRRRAAREQVESIDAGSLKAVCKMILDALDAGASQTVIEKRVQSAWYEQMRCHANCIVQYETAKVFNERQSYELMADKDVEFVEIRRSRSEPKSEICDVYAKVDRFGLGAGVFPKELAPRPPHIRACKCVIAPRLELRGKKSRFREGAELAFVRSLPREDAVRILRSEDNLEAVLGGRSVTEVFNATLHPLHRVTIVRAAAETYAARLATASVMAK